MTFDYDDYDPVRGNLLRAYAGRPDRSAQPKFAELLARIRAATRSQDGHGQIARAATSTQAWQQRQK